MIWFLFVRLNNSQFFFPGLFQEFMASPQLWGSMGKSQYGGQVNGPLWNTQRSCNGLGITMKSPNVLFRQHNRVITELLQVSFYLKPLTSLIKKKWRDHLIQLPWRKYLNTMKPFSECIEHSKHSFKNPFSITKETRDNH